MPTNDERREVAARLRELPDIPSEMGTWEGGLMFIEPSRADEADYSQIHKVLFGCLPADLMHPCDYEELHNRLADLIEPEERTCHMVFDHLTDTAFCDVCGERFDGVAQYMAMVPNGFSVADYKAKYKDAKFCPHCGAKAVE